MTLTPEEWCTVHGPDLLIDAFGRIRDRVNATVDGLTPSQLAHRVDPGANSIAWLVWHLTRIQDDHIAHVAGIDQVWTSGNWNDRFGLPFPDDATGYGHTSEDVAAVKIDDPALLIGYHAATHEITEGFLRELDDETLGRVVDERYDPPVTMGVRLVSVIGDNYQHIGQAAFVRGIVLRG
nr:DinB family protein [Jiangella mangrovi]